jgi:hypothetical protein
MRSLIGASMRIWSSLSSEKSGVWAAAGADAKAAERKSAAAIQCRPAMIASLPKSRGGD